MLETFSTLSQSNCSSRTPTPTPQVQHCMRTELQRCWQALCCSSSVSGQQAKAHSESSVADVALVSVDDLQPPVDAHILCTLGQLLRETDR